MKREISGRRWPSGPWDDEPDRFEFDSGGYRGIARRVESLGHWAGYVDVPVSHPWAEFESIHDPRVSEIECHGGITYCGKSEDGAMRRLGFDCAHAFDLIPAVAALLEDGRVPADTPCVENYRPLSYVVSQITALIEQAKAAAK